MNSVLQHRFGPELGFKEGLISSSRIIDPEGDSRDAVMEEFINEYHDSGVWIFRGNYKRSGTKKYYASDAQLVQIAMMGIDKHPHMIVRKEVKNIETLEATQYFESGTDELMEAFFNTPNGKNTTQLIEATKMEALSVERSTPNGADFPSFYIKVRKKISTKKAEAFP